jgi:hypothetical protein
MLGMYVFRVHDVVDAGVDELRLPLARVTCYVQPPPPPAQHWPIQIWFKNPYNI